MKTIRGLLSSELFIQLMMIGFTLVVLLSFAQAEERLPQAPFDLEIDMTGAEYRPLIESYRKFLPINDTREPLFSSRAPNSRYRQLRNGDVLDAILDLGKRNLDWVDAINKTRPLTGKLELSTPETQAAIPIDQPRYTNRNTIQSAFNDFKAKSAPAFSQVLFGAVGLPTSTNGMSDDAFLEHARAFDRVYQSASRWLLQEPYLSQYAARKRDDIRGYFFLSRISNVERLLEGWMGLSNDEKARFAEWLAGICANSGGSLESCQATLSKTIERERNPISYFNHYMGGAKEKFLSYFRVQNPRRDATWGAGGSTFVVPFKLPNTDVIARWLKFNVEDEWRVQGFKLVIEFKPSGFGMTSVVFAPGATPHVNGLGGNTITMDSNRSIEEYSSRWTIRHEYGHTLGFPDCYVEFYDSGRGMMVNYQIDTTNLMCSRRGHLLPIHVTELRRAYGSGGRGRLLSATP